MIRKRVNANVPTLARLAPACVLLYNVNSHSHSKRKCSTLMLSSAEPLLSAWPENGGCKPLLCGLLCRNLLSLSVIYCHFLSLSVIYCHFLSFSVIFKCLQPVAGVFRRFLSPSVIYCHFMQFTVAFCHFLSLSLLFKCLQLFKAV